ncbi:hypothetical protein CHS0354_041630 [Potamilus streckersoni]|uniref:Uncharacterized protein n=1 Tax=Potamilus streckersoni TaxID=2493646 RepID=A0AAE0SDU1_9BIVA|nr:hypothetical protein CHS0354_041630 [Potamilus streckersoni]
MPLSTYPFLKDDTRLILHKDTVFKVKVKYVDFKIIKNVNFPFTEQAAHQQIEQVLRAVFYADERNSDLKPILTEHLLITPVKVPWKAARYFGFKKDGTVLKTFPFVFEIDVRVRDEIVENVRKATIKSAIIQQPSKRDDKKDQTFQKRFSENRIEKQLNNEIVEDNSSTANPSKPSTSNTALERDETGRFHRVIDGNRNQSPQEQLTTSECVKKYKEILQKAQSKTDTQKNTADQEVHSPFTVMAAVSPSNLESQGGSETLKQPSQTKRNSRSKDKSSQSPCNREITPQRNEDVSGRGNKNKIINLEDISKIDADLEMEQSEKPVIPRLSTKRCFDEKGTENEKARSVSMNKSKRTYQSSRTKATENSTSMSGSYSEKEQHIGKRLRSVNQTEKYKLSFKMSHRNDNSPRDNVLVGVDNNQNELHGHKIKSVHNKNPIETNSSTNKNVVTKDIKRKRKGNSGVQRKMVLKNLTDRIQTRSQIAELNATKVTEKRHMPLKKVHKIKTQSKSEETNTFSLGLHRCDEEINAQSALSPRISHVRPFKSAKSDEKQIPPGSPLRNSRNLDGQVLDENLNPNTSNQAQRTRGQECQIGDETDRLLNMSLRNPPERRISNRRSLDRYMIEREELEETLKLQQLAQSTSPRRSSRILAKTSKASSRKRSGLWDMVETFIYPVKKLLKSE